MPASAASSSVRSIRTATPARRACRRATSCSRSTSSRRRRRKPRRRWSTRRGAPAATPSCCRSSAATTRQSISAWSWRARPGRRRGRQYPRRRTEGVAGTPAEATSGEGSPRELTLRGVLLGGAITLLFTAANVYLGLKVGLTFATSIPAAVISMAVLRWFRDSSILENNIVQTVASAAGTLAAICFVLPGLVMIGWWHDFPYWETASITALGGILGVLFSVPLRRALVNDSPLPYPEGVAAAEVLRVGENAREAEAQGDGGVEAIATGSILSALFALLA